MEFGPIAAKISGEIGGVAIRGGYSARAKNAFKFQYNFLSKLDTLNLAVPFE